MRHGTIVDATIIAAPSSTKHKAGERDREMHQTKKGHQWYFGNGSNIETLSLWLTKVFSRAFSDESLYHSLVFVL